MAENIKFIREIMKCSSFKNGHGKEFGNFIYYDVNEVIAKVWCQSDGVVARIINPKTGEVDTCIFPFANYFSKKKCSPSAPEWNQHIENGKWYFSQYPHVLPTTNDYCRIANAVTEYIKLFWR